MPYCPKCGKQVKKGDQFCSKCGASLGGGNAYQRQEPQVPRMIDRKCVFCKGTGIDPGRGIADVTGEKCRVCEGSGSNKRPKHYIKCEGKCKGTGRIDIRGSFDLFPNFKPCPDCEGTGWADPSRFE